MPLTNSGWQKKDLEKTKQLNKYVSADEITQKEATLFKKQAVLDLKELDYSNTRVLSPIDGVVTKKYFEKGETVSVGDKVFEIVQLDELIMIANVPSKEVAQFKKGTQVTFTVDEFKDRTFKAEVVFVSPVIEAASDTVKVKLGLTNPRQGGEYLLKPGMVAELLPAVQQPVAKAKSEEAKKD